MYDDAVREALIVLWEASDRICGKRLRPMMPVLVESMERHGHLQLAPEVRTFDGWDDSAPGCVEADLVAQSGPTAKGSFVQTLTLTEIATGWTGCAPLLVREQTLLPEVLGEVRKSMSFVLVGFGSDNDSVFLNERVRDYCAAGGIEFTRCPPYRKNDRAWVEQKNGAVVRHAVGYRRLEGLEAAAGLGRLYGSLRLFVNLFQPSFKLAGKTREGARVKKRCHPPATPYQRLLADPRTSDEAGVPPTAPALEHFLAGLHTSWREGEVRPTAQPKAKTTRERRRPNPLIGVTALLQGWYEAEPWRTSRELLDRLQVQQPGIYPDGLMRTVQRRMKGWRRDVAHTLVFGRTPDGEPTDADEAAVGEAVP